MLTGVAAARKRRGEALAAAAWTEIITGVGHGDGTDAEVVELLRAVWDAGLTPAELDAVTDAMLASGRRFAFGPGVPPRVDKHSTGGVGDKTSLVLAPLVASCGLAVPMLSGRGLGHTGGTLDKLEAIPGFRVDLTLAEAARQVERIGCAMLGQTDEVAPADRRLYALRHVSGTVASIPLVAASIMSKKLAEDLQGLVLDVKQGSGAFFPDPTRATTLAELMVQLGERRGCRTVAVLTAMDRPLGFACGNALEVEEAIAVLRGEGPADLVELTLALGAEMLVLGGAAADAADATLLLREALSSGRALERWAALIEAQGGNPAIVDDPAALPQARRSAVWESPRDGWVSGVAPRPIGEAIVALGGGRRALGDTVDPAVGFVVTAGPGDRVVRGQPLATICARDHDGLAAGRRALDEAITVADEPPPAPLPLVGRRVALAR